MDQQPSSSTSSPPRALLAGLALVAAGAALVLIGLAGTPGDVAGLAAMAVGTILAAPYSDRSGASVEGWWTVLVAGTLIALVGAAVGLGVESLGGLLTVLGGVLAAVAVALGYPGRS